MSYKLEHDGKTVALPDFKALPVGVIRKARKVDAEEAMWFILEEVLDAKALAVIDNMPLEDFTKAMNGWTQGAPLGESSQSSN